MSAFQLAAGCQSYDWGKIGRESKAAIYAQTNPSFNLDESKPYAELWMGTHPSCPSYVLSTGETLLSAIQKDPQGLLGKNVVARFGEDLPFLFKVLAIRKALSIQAHPNKTLAKRLHQERPDLYKDANHKPEMALALTPFSGFCGFLPVEDITDYLSFVPELVALVKPSIAEAFRATVTETPPLYESIHAVLKDVFTELMTANEEEVKVQVAYLVKRYEDGGAKEVELGVKDLVLELNRQYPGDVGIFCAFMLNVVNLKPGQAIFLKADEPHAYINGDIMECMATSDNVVRAGLTPKHRDVPTLVSMLTYTWGPADSQIMPPQPFRGTKHTTIYDPPIDEFSVLLTELGSGDEEVHDVIDGPSILVVTRGTGELSLPNEAAIKLDREGLVYFIAAGAKVTFRGGASGLTFYRAFVEAA